MSAKQIERLRKRVDMLAGIVRAAQSQIDQAMQVIESINGDIKTLQAEEDD